LLILFGVAWPMASVILHFFHEEQLVPPEESPAISTVLPPAFSCSVTSPICGGAVWAPLGTPVFARS